MGDKATTRAYNDHNVYILGAGFSAEAGLPLIRDFMNRMRDAAAWLEEQGCREQELQAIERVLEFRLRAAAAAYRVPLNVENVEELFSLASASTGEGLAEDMALAIAATLDYARSTAPSLAEHQCFTLGILDVLDWTKPPNWQPPPAGIEQQVQSGELKGQWYRCPPYEFYLGIMCGYFNEDVPNRRDTIITFNYDLLIEESLQALGVPFGYGCEVSRDKSAETMVATYGEANVQVLKLHGSINWTAFSNYLSSSDEEERRARPLELGQADDEDWERPTSKGYPGPRVFGSYSELRAKGFHPLLVPPTWRKDISVDLSATWQAAVTALRTATRIIMLGYSVPPTDQHFKFLLAAGLQDNISLRKVFFVNPALAEPETGKQLKERLFGLLRPEHFDQGVVEIVATGIREFLAGPRNFGSESYRARIGRPLNPPGRAWDTARWRFFPPFGGSRTIE
jgi:hypothetical protein